MLAGEGVTPTRSPPSAGARDTTKLKQLESALCVIEKDIRGFLATYNPRVEAVAAAESSRRKSTPVGGNLAERQLYTPPLQRHHRQHHTLPRAQVIANSNTNTSTSTSTNTNNEDLEKELKLIDSQLELLFRRRREVESLLRSDEAVEKEQEQEQEVDISSSNSNSSSPGNGQDEEVQQQEEEEEELTEGKEQQKEEGEEQQKEEGEEQQKEDGEEQQEAKERQEEKQGENAPTGGEVNESGDANEKSWSASPLQTKLRHRTISLGHKLRPSVMELVGGGIRPQETVPPSPQSSVNEDNEKPQLKRSRSFILRAKCIIGVSTDQTKDATLHSNVPTRKSLQRSAEHAHVASSLGSSASESPASRRLRTLRRSKAPAPAAMTASTTAETTTKEPEELQKSGRRTRTLRRHIPWHRDEQKKSPPTKTRSQNNSIKEQRQRDKEACGDYLRTEEARWNGFAQEITKEMGQEEDSGFYHLNLYFFATNREHAVRFHADLGQFLLQCENSVRVTRSASPAPVSRFSSCVFVLLFVIA